MADKSALLAGPIPGANYTSDTKNYPWHRPPEVTNLDDAIEVSFKKLTDENAAVGVLTMLEMGATVASLTHSFVMSGVGAGKWTPDFAILLAGPVSHIIYLMAKGYGINPDMGIDDKVHPPTKAFFKAKKIDMNRLDEAAENVPIEMIKQNAGNQANPSQQASGFMGMANPAETPAAEAVEQPQEAVEPEVEPAGEV